MLSAMILFLPQPKSNGASQLWTQASEPISQITLSLFLIVLSGISHNGEKTD
jgi:hypothetical protein